MRRNLLRSIFLLPLPALLAAALSVSPAAAQDLKSFEARTTVHVLANGWTFLLVERHQTPVFSFATLARVGSDQEVTGITGLAHMFEHMAFKGTETIGTTNYPEEKKAIEALEAAYQAYQTERLAQRPDPQKVEALWKTFKARQAEADKFVVKNEFGDIVDREGGSGVNAFTSADETVFFYGLPSNKTELWAYLESERFLRPVLREFYEERDVVHEERRQSTDSEPIGRLVEQFQATAFVAHPYHHPTIGYESDLQAFTLTDAQAFYRANYAPGNLITAVVGDIHPKELVPLLERYFGRIPARPLPAPLRTVEPPQTAEKVVTLEDLAQPIYLEAYHKPAETDPDQATFDAIDDILSAGRTSRLYRALVRDHQLAVQVNSFSGFPGKLYPNLWAILAVPGFGITNEQVQTALRAEIEKLKTADVTDEELARFKTRAKARLLHQLRDNSGLASELVEYQRLYGDWRELFRELDRYDKVTKADIRRVAQKTFQKENRTVTQLVTKPQPDGPPGAADPNAPDNPGRPGTPGKPGSR
jgi:predicted Zn-dependent peptidase